MAAWPDGRGARTGAGLPSGAHVPSPGLRRAPARARRRAVARGRAGSRVARTVVLLGLTSLFTDISSEMVSAILPLYLDRQLGLSPLQFGVIDGIYQGGSASSGSSSASPADRWAATARSRPLGYGLSAICKLGLLARRHRVRRDRRDRPARPHRQGHPHRAARRDDLAGSARGGARRRRSACTARWTPAAR